MPAIDDFGGHEVLHTAYLIEDLFHRQIVEHLYVQTHVELLAVAVRVHEALADFYQFVGSVTDLSPLPSKDS